MESSGNKMNKKMKEAYLKARKDLQSKELGTCLDEEMLVSYMENRLNTAEEQKAEKHLSLCTKCSEYVMILNKVQNFSFDEELPDPSDEVIDKAVGLANKSEQGVFATPTHHPFKAVFERIGAFIEFFRPNAFAFSTAGAAALVVLLVVIAVKGSLFRAGVDPSSFKLAASVVARQPAFNGSAYSYLQKGTSDPLKKEVVIEGVGGVLQPSAKFQINFKANQEAYIYVFIERAQKGVFQLFPDPKREQSDLISKNTEYLLPAADRWYYLNETPGRTTIYIIATKKRFSHKKNIISMLQSDGFSQVIKNFESMIISTKVLGFVQTDNKDFEGVKRN